VFVEDATWNALCDIAREQHGTVDDLCLTIGDEFSDAADFTQAARYYVLRPLAAKLPHSIDLPPELRAFKELTGQRLVQ
jgi:predicted DNA-binding ribbon-helix-helix protein